jgi:hypothetical protein
MVSVKGRRLPTKIYTLIDLINADKDQIESLKQNYQAFLTAYRNQQWDAAMHLIDICHRIGVSRLDTCYALFASRIEVLRQSSLGPNWDGAFAMAEK